MSDAQKIDNILYTALAAVSHQRGPAGILEGVEGLKADLLAAGYSIQSIERGIPTRIEDVRAAGNP